MALFEGRVQLHNVLQFLMMRNGIVSTFNLYIHFYPSLFMCLALIDIHEL